MLLMGAALVRSGNKFSDKFRESKDFCSFRDICLGRWPSQSLFIVPVAGWRKGMLHLVYNQVRRLSRR